MTMGCLFVSPEITVNDILMTAKPTYKELERRIKQLEREVLGYVRKEKEFNEERKFLEYSHVRRTISLMKINEELKRESIKLNRSDAEELGLVSHRLKERIKELNCLYDISSFRDATDFSLDAVLQAVIDFLEEKPALDEGPFLKEAKNLIGAIAETLAKIVEREWAEAEIRKHRNHVEKLIKNSNRNITGTMNE